MPRTHEFQVYTQKKHNSNEHHDNTYDASGRTSPHPFVRRFCEMAGRNPCRLKGILPLSHSQRFQVLTRRKQLKKRAVDERGFVAHNAPNAQEAKTASPKSKNSYMKERVGFFRRRVDREYVLTLSDIFARLSYKRRKLEM